MALLKKMEFRLASRLVVISRAEGLGVSLGLRTAVIMKTETGDNQLRRWCTVKEISDYEGPFEVGNKVTDAART